MQTKGYLDKALSGVSNGIFNKQLIADLVLPKTTSKNYTGKIGGFNPNHLYRQDTLMKGEAMARRVNAVDYNFNTLFEIGEYGLHDVVTKRDYADVEDPFDAESDTVEGLTSIMQIDKEVALSSVLFNASVITQTAVPAAKWDTDSSTILKDIVTAKSTVKGSVQGLANAAILGYKLSEVLRRSKVLMDALGYKYNRVGELSDAELAKALGVEELFIGSAAYNNAKEGQSDNIVDIWNEESALFYVKPASAAKKQISLGYHISPTGAQGRQVYKSDINNPPESKLIVITEAYTQKIVNVNAGFLFTDCL